MTHVVQRLADGIVARALALGVDGVDLVQKEGCGVYNLRCDDLTSIHLTLLEKIRQSLPLGKTLSYTFPINSGSRHLDFPFVDVVKYGLQYLDSISLMGLEGASNKTIQSALDLGVPASKVHFITASK